MRSVKAGAFARIADFASLWRAWKLCRRGKRRRPHVAAFDLDADRHLCRLHRDLIGGNYRPGSFRLSVVHEPKTRLVAAPEIRDRVVHRALLHEIGDVYERGFIDQSYACRTGRGPHRAALAFLGHLRRHRHRLSLDIRQYFASIDHGILVSLFARRLARNPEALELVERLVRSGGEVYSQPLARRIVGEVPPGRGIPLGGYLSHWSGALYLDGLDHFVRRTLKISAYQRFMDDLTLFHDDRGRLEQARQHIAEWLAAERRLTLHPKGRRVHATSEACTYLGFRISRSGLAAGKKTRDGLRHRLEHADSLGQERLVRSLRSYRGLMTRL